MHKLSTVVSGVQCLADMSRGTKWVLEPSMARQCTQNAHNAVHNADRRYLMTQPALDVYDVDVADI